MGWMLCEMHNNPTLPNMASSERFLMPHDFHHYTFGCRIRIRSMMRSFLLRVVT